MLGIYSKIVPKLKKLNDSFQYRYYYTKRRGEVFKFQNGNYPYFIHPYNYTWQNERIIEIPIFRKILLDNQGKDILEVGNVLAHYFDISHDVLDKYEKGKGVINKDAANFKSKKKYDLIISISTMEHIGWDEKIKNNKKIFKVIKNLQSHLKKGGKIITTLPLGYNPFIDEYLQTNQLKFTKKFLLKRVSEDNKWKEFPWEKSKGIKYNYPFLCANGVVIGIINN